MYIYIYFAGRKNNDYLSPPVLKSSQAKKQILDLWPVKRMLACGLHHIKNGMFRSS